MAFKNRALYLHLFNLSFILVYLLLAFVSSFIPFSEFFSSSSATFIWQWRNCDSTYQKVLFCFYLHIDLQCKIFSCKCVSHCWVVCSWLSHMKFQMCWLPLQRCVLSIIYPIVNFIFWNTVFTWVNIWKRRPATKSLKILVSTLPKSNSTTLLGE